MHPTDEAPPLNLFPTTRPFMLAALFIAQSIAARMAAAFFGIEQARANGNGAPPGATSG